MKGVTFLKGFIVIFLIVFVVWYYFYYVNMLYKGYGADSESDLSKQLVKNFPFAFDNHGLTGFEDNKDGEEDNSNEGFYVPYPRYWNYPPIYTSHLPMLYRGRGERYNRNARWWYLNYPPYTSPPRRNWFYWRNYFYG